MAVTLTDLYNLVLHKLGLQSDDQMVQTGNVYKSINTGLKAMATDYDWPWLITSHDISTVAGTEAYALETGLESPTPFPIHVRTLWIANEALGRNLKAVQRKVLTKWYVTDSAQGPPLFYSVYGASIRIAPRPDKVYTLKHTYIQPEPDLTSGSDEPLCPEHFSDVIACYAAFEECTRLKDFSQRAAFQADITAWKQRMKDNVRQEASTLSIQARDDWGW
jgi:hypothetical protein